MFKSRQSQEDRTQTSLKRTRQFLEAVDVVSDEVQLNFDDLDIEGKKHFLTKYYTRIIDVCIAKFGKEFANLRNFHWFVLENEGRAIVYFQRKDEKENHKLSKKGQS